MRPLYSFQIQIKNPIMVAYGGIATVSERTGASIANTRHIIRVSTEYPSFDFGHETAMVVPDDLPYDLVVLHFSSYIVGSMRR